MTNYIEKPTRSSKYLPIQYLCQFSPADQLSRHFPGYDSLVDVHNVVAILSNDFTNRLNRKWLVI